MEHAHDIQKEVRRYLLVFGALMILTVITVAISYLHMPVPAAITLALIVATIKGGLVACFFMHLISEKQFIYVLLIFVVIFFFSLGLIIFGYYDTPQGTDTPRSDQRSAIVHDAGSVTHDSVAPEGAAQHTKAAAEHQEHQ